MGTPNAEDILKSTARLVNSLSSDNKVARRRAIDDLRKETVARSPPLDKDELQVLALELHRPVLLLLSDESEKCREISLDMIREFLTMIPRPMSLLPSTIPVFVQRLGQLEVNEESEELRLVSVQTLTLVIELANEGIVQYLEDYIKILKQTIKDAYAEVKKESYKCASLLAKTIPAYFHQQSESLINPLLTQISHQHSKVRVAVIYCIGDVIRFGNNKCVEDVISHLAQRVFDPIPAVRLALTNVIGDWMLNLPDRYSFWPKMIPLLLSMIDDSQDEISSTASEFWDRSGIQFEEENEQELKDKLDFSIEVPSWYPKDTKRPCVGCRVLIYRNFGRFISGIQNDICDWVPETRVKTACLMYHCLLNVEDSVTQFLAKVAIALQKGALDDNKQVIKYIQKSSELIGYFVHPESWTEVFLPVVASAQNQAGLLILANIVKGCQPEVLVPFVPKIMGCVSADDVCRSFQQPPYLSSLQSVVAELCFTLKSQVEPHIQQLFDIAITSSALALEQTVVNGGNSVLGLLAQTVNVSREDLFQRCTASLLSRLADKDHLMATQSPEYLIFEWLVLQSGSAIGMAVPEVIQMFQIYLQPEREPELRLKFFTVMCKLVLAGAGHTLDSQGALGEHVVTLIQGIILPNCVWRAGRTAAAVRTSAVTALWALLEGHLVTPTQMTDMRSPLLTSLTSLLDEDNTSTRLIATKALRKLLESVTIECDELHKLIPELVKRLDDRDDGVRLSVTHTFIALVHALPEEYNSGLYKAHCEAMFEGLLVHLDDADPSVQQAVLSVLLAAARLNPRLLADRAAAVRDRHRSPKYCDQLIHACHSSGDS